LDTRLVDDLELEPTDLEERGGELRPVGLALQIAQPIHGEVDAQAKLRLHVLVRLAEWRGVALLEVLKRLPCVEGLPFGELDLALVEQAECGGGRETGLFETLATDDQRLFQDLGRRDGIMRRERHADEARAEGLDAEAPAHVADEPVFVRRGLEDRLQRRSTHDLFDEAARLDQLLQYLGLL